MRRIVYLSTVAVASLLSFSGCDKENPENGNTEAKGPKVETLSAEKRPLYYVSLTGRISGLEGVALDFECGIEYSTDASFSDDKTIRQKVAKKYSEDAYTITITNVSSGQVYYYRAYYISQSMIYYGDVKDFTFSWDAPQVATLSAELLEVGGTEIVVCKGLVKDLGDILKYHANNRKLRYGILYSTSDSFETSSTQTAELYSYDEQMGDTIVCSVSVFKYDTQYYYRAFFSFDLIYEEGDIKSFRYVFTPKENGSENGYNYIEMGLSVKWATFNVGATTPEEYGDYYSWGETEPKPYYYWYQYKWCKSMDKMTKYCRGGCAYYGCEDTLTTLEPEDDVAHVKWGGSWRMPTKAEQDELYNNCTWTLYDSDNTEFNGVRGYKVTSNIEGYTDRFIFLPGAGYAYDACNVRGPCYYWSSSLNTGRSDGAYVLIYPPSEWNEFEYSNRFAGFSVRPVCP